MCKFYKRTLYFYLTFVKYAKARRIGNCAEISFMGDFMQIFSINFF